MKLMVSVEIQGKQILVGSLNGNNYADICFKYDKDYISGEIASPISVSLPIQEETFSIDKTRNFFEGLLPEGFTRRSVAGWLHADEYDYVSILKGLGNECLGAIRVYSEDEAAPEAYYEKLSTEDVLSLAKEGATKSAEIITKSHLSLTGASGKVGLLYDNGEWYQPMGSAPSSHIVKQSHVRLDSIVLNEHFSLLTAKNLGLDVASSFIVNMGDGNDDTVLFASERYDRIRENGRIIRLHQEDFAQAMSISSADKYEKAGENHLYKMVQIIRNDSSDPASDMTKLFKLALFNFLIGNTDNHIKNTALLYGSNFKTVKLAPAYDVLSTCIYEQSTRNMAYSINGKYALDDITLDDFYEEADRCKVGRRIIKNAANELLDGFEEALNISAEALSEQGLGKAVLIKERILKNCGYSIWNK